MSLEAFAEKFEEYSIDVQVQRQVNGEDKILLTYYNGDEPAGSGAIWDGSGITDHIEWLHELIVDVENALAHCSGHSDAKNFAGWAAEFGSPVTVPVYQGEEARAENQYQEALERMADEWVYLHEAYKELQSIFGGVYNELVDAMTE